MFAQYKKIIMAMSGWMVLLSFLVTSVAFPFAKTQAERKDEPSHSPEAPYEDLEPQPSPSEETGGETLENHNGGNGPTPAVPDENRDPSHSGNDSLVPPKPLPDGPLVSPDISPDPGSDEKPVPMPLPDESSPYMISIYDCERGSIFYKDLEEYVLLVLASEMTAYYDWNMEALKAQAIAIRSYALASDNNKAVSHHGAVVCTSFKHCMAFKSMEEFNRLESRYKNRYLQAIRETKGLVLTYKGEIARTYFHWCSYSSTESALEVFGQGEDYLVPVKTGIHTEIRQKITFKSSHLLSSLFGRATANALLNSQNVPFGGFSRTESGRIKDVTLYGKTISGLNIRSLLQLNSTDFDITYDGEKDLFTFFVRGSGHGVGMSQSGALLMAKEGKTTEEILYHYYVGTTIEKNNKDPLLYCG